MYIFVGVLNDFRLPRSWRDIELLNKMSPKLSKKVMAQWKKLDNFPRDQIDYSDPVSVASLMEAGLLLPLGRVKGLYFILIRF